MSYDFPDFYIHERQQDIIFRGVAAILESLIGKRDRALANSKTAPADKREYYRQWAELHEAAIAAIENGAYKNWFSRRYRQTGIECFIGRRNRALANSKTAPADKREYYLRLAEKHEQTITALEAAFRPSQ